MPSVVQQKKQNKTKKNNGAKVTTREKSEGKNSPIICSLATGSKTNNNPAVLQPLSEGTGSSESKKTKTI